mgnify:CR=1 FL=1
MKQRINKILVIAEARVGGYYFTKYLANGYGLEFHHEPRFPHGFNMITSNTSKLCTKLYIGHVIQHYKEHMISLEEKASDFCKIIGTYGFDNIFILDRRNVREHIESMVNMWKLSTNMHGDWKPTDKLDSLLTDGRIEYYTQLKIDHGLFLNKISEELDIPVIYYEDLYYNTSIVDLQGLDFIADLNKKLRKDDKPQTLL